MKTYFIGLGGCGLKTVAEISKRLKKDPNSNYAEDYAFTYIDTDMYTVNALNETEIVIPASDFVDMGPTVPLAIYNEALHTEHPNADSKRFLEWVIDQKPGHMILPNQPLTDGATAQRNVGRCGIYHYYDAIENELDRKISRFSSITPNEDGRRDVDIWVVASSCGGTGSSMILDVLYMINRIANPIACGEPKVKLVMYMPQAFVELNNDNPNHKLNGYSCMEEINFFRSNYEENKKQTFEAFAVRPTKKGDPILDFPLFQFMIPICSENSASSRMTVEQLYPTVAEMIYYLNTGNGKNSMQSDLSNLLVQILQKSKETPGITSQMVGYGFRAIKKANNELKDYMTKRALYEVVKYGLLDNNRIDNFSQLQMDFANETVLSNLITLPESITENDVTYKYTLKDNDLQDKLEDQVKKYVDNSTKYDRDAITTDVIKSIDTKLNRLLSGNDFDEIKQTVYGQITQKIDKKLNEFILDHGLQHAYDMLNTIDDFYLEPLCRYIVATMLPNATAQISSASFACNTYIKDGFKRRKMATVAQCIDKYKNAVANAISLKIATQIINDLTEAPRGYLEKLRKGDNNGAAGIRNLKKLLDNDCMDFKDEYGDLSKKFRATSNDAMTVYLPSLADIATGINNNDWAEDNFFDQLYQESILEQKDIEMGLEKIKIPVRNSKDSRGLKNILEKIDIDRNVFVKVIKEKMVNLPLNKDQKIINPLKKAVESLINDPSTAAGEWINQKLSEAIYNNPSLLPKAFKKTADLFNSFKDVNRVPVFFPLRGGKQMPSTVRLMFVGDNIDLAKELGFDSANKKQQHFVEDSSMNDRFMVMRMPVGLEFNMYKYYPYYKTFYTSDTYSYKVRNKEFGCHIHQTFNEYGFNLPQIRDGGTTVSKGISEQLAERRVDALVRCLFYQHVSNILRETDKMSYNKLFGFTAAQLQFDDSDLTPDMRELLGIDSTSIALEDTKPGQFISFDLDLQKRSIKLQMRPVKINPKTGYLEIDSNTPKVFEFDKNHFEKCDAFVDQLLTIPAELFSVVEYMSNRFAIENDEQLHRTLNNVKTGAKQRLMRQNDPTIKFAFCLRVWSQYDPQNTYLKAITDTINSL